jgi:hypothetical protein
VSALNEASCRTSARTQGKCICLRSPSSMGFSFMQSWGGSRDLFCHTLCDNNAGNNLPMLAAEHYTKQFRDMHLPYNKTFEADPALWTLQMSHQTRKCPDPSGKRHCFNVFHHCHVNTNRFSTWLDLAVTLTKPRKRCCFVLEPMGGALPASGASN